MPNSVQLYRKFSVLAAVWGLLILIMTLIPGNAVPQWKLFTYDKLGHFGLFGVLSFLTAKGVSYASGRSGRRGRVFMYSVIGSSLYGLMIEVIQFFVPGRYASHWDILANTIGALLGFWVFTMGDKFINGTKKK